jgi:hypothetical protein
MLALPTSPQIEQVIGAFGRQTFDLIALQRHNAPVGKALLLDNGVFLVVPAGCFKPGSHICSTGFRLVHTPAFLLFFV